MDRGRGGERTDPGMARFQRAGSWFGSGSEDGGFRGSELRSGRRPVTRTLPMRLDATKRLRPSAKGYHPYLPSYGR